MSDSIVCGTFQSMYYDGMVPCDVCPTQGSIGSISSQFTEDLLEANHQLEATRETMTADIARMRNICVLIIISSIIAIPTCVLSFCFSPLAFYTMGHKKIIILIIILTRKRAIAKALQLEGHPDFTPVDLAYYQYFLGFFVPKYCVLGSSTWQPQMQSTWRHASSQR